MRRLIDQFTYEATNDFGLLCCMDGIGIIHIICEGEYGTLQFHDLFCNFHYLEINKYEDYNQELEGWEQIERKEIDRELYDSFNNELGIDVELLAYVAQSAKLGKQGGDEGFEKDQD